MLTRGSLQAMENNNRIVAAVVVLPAPLTPAALFCYGILRFLGYINEEKTHARFTRVAGPHAELFGCEGRIADLRGNLYPGVLGLIGSDTILKRMLTFASFGDQIVHSRLESVLRKLNTENSRLALSEVFCLVVDCVETKSDPWKSAGGLEVLVETLGSLATQSRQAIVYPPDKRFLSFPVFQEKNSGHRTEDDITGSFGVTLEEGKIFALRGKHLGIAIGGPRGSGKRTLSVSLVAEMDNCLRSLQTRASFADLDVKVGLQTFDMGTPTTRAIQEGWAATDQEKLLSQKQPWNMGLARQSLKGFLRSRGKYNIVVSDLPGRITDITRIIAASADAGIVVRNDLEFAKTNWFPFMRSVGVPIVAKIRSRQGNEGLSSLVSHWRPGELFSCRVTALNRSNKSWDLFIQWLALFLLFDILPKQFGEERDENII